PRGRVDEELDVIVAQACLVARYVLTKSERYLGSRGCVLNAYVGDAVVATSYGRAALHHLAPGNEHRKASGSLLALQSFRFGVQAQAVDHRQVHASDLKLALSTHFLRKVHDPVREGLVFGQADLIHGP